MKNDISSKTFWQTIFAFSFVVNLVIVIWSISRWIELKVILYRSIWMILLMVYLAILIGCVFLFVKIHRGRADKEIGALELDQFTGTFWRVGGWLIFIAILFAIPYIKFTLAIGEEVKKPLQDPILITIVFYWSVWYLLLLASGTLKVALKTSWAGGCLTALMIMGVAYTIFIRFHAVTAYPFSMSWSESSRYYYASLYFAQSIYGMKIPLSTLHPTRYFLQALPFLVPGLDLGAHRFWQFLLWILLTLGTSVVLIWRVYSLKKPFAWLFVGWLFIFLLQIGVYYHLEVMIIILLLFVTVRRPWRSLIGLIFASVWAGLSRVNWFPVPAMLAIAIYLLEEPVSDYKSLRQYLAQPLTWGVLGVLSALAAQAVYIPLSGNAENVAAFGSSLNSDLLLSRLWPNDSYPLGVILGILIVSGPLLFTLIQMLPNVLSQLHWVRSLGLFAFLAVLFMGGLVVSIKIGGGGDLHNLDAFAVLLSIVVAYFLSGKTQAESDFSDWRMPFFPAMLIALLLPLIFLIPSLSPMPKFNEKADAEALEQLRGLLEDTGQNRPVLFITERHLVTFGTFNLLLEPDYENVTLMEMAMSNNQPYLNKFYDDLKNHRFNAIVSGKQNEGVKEDGVFAEENNIWNARVAHFILCYYEPVRLIKATWSRIEVFYPRAQAVCP
jgi:hypothetical protein